MPKPVDTLVIGKAADPQTIDPAVTIDNNDMTITYPAYQRLVAYEVKDGKVRDFKLKPGNMFSDGSAIDAAAVKFSFERLMTLAQGPSEAFPVWLTVEAVDPATVSFTPPEDFAPFLDTLVNSGAAIVHPAVMAQDEDGDLAQGWLSANTAGSGAFQLSAWEKGQSITMVPNPNHAGDAPALTSVQVRIIPDAPVRRLALEAGEIDIPKACRLTRLKPSLRLKASRLKPTPAFW